MRKDNQSKKERLSKPFFLNVNILRVLGCQNDGRNNDYYSVGKTGDYDSDNTIRDGFFCRANSIFVSSCGKILNASIDDYQGGDNRDKTQNPVGNIHNSLSDVSRNSAWFAFCSPS